MAFALRPKDDAGHGRDLRAIEQDICRVAAVAADRGDVGKCIEGSGGRCARQANFVEARQK